MSFHHTAQLDCSHVNYAELPADVVALVGVI